METDSVKLICEVSKPSAEVTWYKGEQELPEGGRYEQIMDGKRRILIIQDLKMEDVGEYTCRLSPTIKTSGNLMINGNTSDCCPTNTLYHQTPG
jgi:titin